MRLKTWLIAVAVAVSVGLLVFGREAVSYVAGARDFARDAVKDRMPTEMEVARLKSMLRKVGRTIDSRREALVEMQLEAEASAKEIDGRRHDLSADRTALEKAAALLRDRQGTYAIGGLSYTYEEVDTDARIKAARFRQDRDLLATRQDTLTRFTEAINDSRNVLSNAEVERQKLADEIERLEIRAVGLKTITEIASGPDTGPDTWSGAAFEDIEHAVGDLGRRLTKGERLTEAQRTGSIGVDYARKERQRSGLEAIQEALQ